MLGKSDVFYKFDDLETMKEEIKKFTSSHAKQHYFVKEIEIGLENLNLPDQVCLVDTPGLNDPVQYRSNITTDYIHSANAVIICVNAKTLRNDEIVTILDVLAKAQNKKDKVYVLGTQIDIMNSQADWEQQQKEWLKHLKEKQFYGSLEQLIGISSYFYSNAIKLDFLSTNEIKKILFETATKGIITQDETLSLLKLETFSNSEIEKIKRKIINYSNIESIQYLIFNTLIMGFNENLKNDFINKYGYLRSKIQVFKNEHMKKIFTNISRFEQDESILKQQILENTRQKEEQENLTKILKTKIQETTKVFNTDFSELNKNFKDFMDKIKKIKFED